MSDEKRELLVFGTKTFKIRVPMAAKITFGPFSPPTKASVGYRTPGDNVGTLRIYDNSKERVIAVFAGVSGYRDLALEYMEEVAVEEGARIWKSDENGYSREESVKGTRRWVEPVTPELNAPATEDDEVF